MKKMFLTVSILLLGLLNYQRIRILIINLTSNLPKNLYFDYQRCNSDGGKYFDPYIERRHWAGSDKLSIEAVIPANCGDFHWIGNYTIHKDKLHLEYKSFNGETLPCGACPVHLFYTIDNIKKLEYNITISDANTYSH